MAPKEISEETKREIVAFQKLSLFDKNMRHILSDVTAKLKCEEMKTIRRIFREIDTDNTSVISRAEFRRGMEMSTQLDPEALDKLFDEVDLDKSGTISWTEFVAASMNADLMGKKDSIKNLFNLLDSDGDGQITR